MKIPDQGRIYRDPIDASLVRRFVSAGAGQSLISGKGEASLKIKNF